MKLQSKLLLALTLSFLVAFCVQVSFNFSYAQQEVVVDLKREARNIRGVLMAMRRVYHHQFIDSGIPLNDATVGFLPAHALSRVSTEFENWSESGLSFNNVSDRPRNSTNAADSLELEAMAFFRENGHVQERFVPFEDEEGESFYHYSRPIWVEQYCLKCHGDRETAPPTIQASYDSVFDYQEGDLRGIMSIKLPAGIGLERAAAASWRGVWIDAAVYVVVFLTIYWTLVRYVVRKLTKLERSCRQLAGGDYGSRSGITGNDEIGRVASVFDGMAQRIEDRDAALKASEERLRITLDAVSDGGWDWNVTTGEVRYSDRWLQSLDYERDEATPHISFWEGIVHPDDTQRVKDVLNAHLNGRTPHYECEMRLRSASGEYQWNLDRGKVVARDGSGKALRMVRTGTDITERKQAENELSESEMRSRTLLDGSPVCNKIIDLDSRLLYMSAAGLRQLKIPDITPYLGCTYPPDFYPESTRTSLIDRLERAKAGETCSVECSVLDTEGCEVWYHSTFVPACDDAGLVKYVLVSSVETTERKLAENELRKLSAAVEQSPAIIIITDTSGTIEYVNPRFTEVTGYTHDEAIGQNPRILNSGKTAKKAYQELWKTILAGKTWRGEFQNKKKNGELYWEAASISPIRDSEGIITHYLAVKEDITERKHAVEELRQAKDAAEVANKAKSEFLANMSHEIRTPMTAIQGFAELVRDEIGCCTECQEVELREKRGMAAEHIGTICRNGENLLNIINDILDLSKIEAGRMTTQRKDCHPCQIVAEVASLMRVRSDDKSMSFNIEYIGGIPETIQSDPTRLRQILINLIGNAIKFTEVGSVSLVIQFVGDRDATCMQFDVIDTGRGMTVDQAANVFQPFTQANTSTTREHGGTGLGLTISKRFAELLGGDITVVETEVGVGTTVRAVVATGPLDGVRMLEDPTSPTVVASTAIPVAEDGPTDLSGLRILLAEDGLDNQQLISFVMERAGGEVTVAENGKLALDAALAARDEGNPFDIILMDMQMPVMDGYDATVQLRQKGYSGPIIALTAHAMEGDREKCINAGCDGYVTKPIDRAELMQTIRRHLVPAQATSPAET